MSTFEEMEITQEIEGEHDWDTIIRMADPFIHAQAGSIIYKNQYLPHPEDVFRNIKPSGWTSFPELIDDEISFKSWRIRDYPAKGFHVHEFDEFYLLHRDTYDPKTVGESINHLIHDTSVSEKLIIGIGITGVVTGLGLFAAALLKGAKRRK